MTQEDLEETQTFWKIRAANYDKLYWTKDDGYIEEIVRSANLEKDHVVLDVGTGTGVIARAVRGHVRHVIAVDISNAMLSEGEWSGISIIQWDVGESLFADGIFDRVFARMVFHHILDNLDRAVLRSYDLLKWGGKIVVAEGVPPTDDPEVVEWFTEMFRWKEARRTFLPGTLVRALERNGFQNVVFRDYFMQDFSVANWLRHSGLEKSIYERIMRIHKEASPKVKDAYQMRETGDDYILRTRNVIAVGTK